MQGTGWFVRYGVVLALAGSLFLAACTRPGSSSGTGTPGGVSSPRALASPSPSHPVLTSPTVAATTVATTAPPPIAPTTAPPPPAAPPTPTPAAGTVPGQKYVVVEGDTIELIAEMFGVTVAELIQANQLENPDLLLIGQELIIPGR